jgi:DNA-directed RNA polymerase subunit RPC12/RpoP
MQFSRFNDSSKVQHVSANEPKKKSLGVCPNCSADLRQDIKTRRPYDSCPLCNTRILPIWWQRVAVVLLGLFLAFAFPAWIGLAGWDVFFVGLLCYYPATVFAYFVVFSTMPPRYVRRRETFTTLFHR